MIAALAWTARLVHIGNLDALALAQKIAAPEPTSALDWPELHVRAVVPQPDESSLVLLHVEWPAYRGQAATLLVSLERGHQRSVALLSQWSTTRASISPTRCGDGQIELRRRQSLERIRGRLVVEDTASRASGGQDTRCPW
jgi:hypothetical protein